MLGRTTQRLLSTQHEVVGLTRGDLELTNFSQVRDCLAAEKPQIVVNCAAYTKVDQAETDQQDAFAGNALAAGNLAGAVAATGAYLISISTDYVFAGNADRPYHEWDACEPSSVYGQSKLAGEQAIQQQGCLHSILRVAWLYGNGGPSFFHTMAKLTRQKGDPLKVVNDQIGNPTSCDAVAELIGQLIDHPLPGIVHATCEGETSWFGFTQAIAEAIGGQRGILPCDSSQFPRPAPRPANSRLDNMALRIAGRPSLPNWQEALTRFIAAYPLP
jgi:dTDP-4-dehydrorhamnose reductase